MDEPSTRTELKPLAVVTGASSGIGYELAKQFCEHGYDLAIAADTPLAEAEQAFRAQGAEVVSLQADLATEAAVQQRSAVRTFTSTTATSRPCAAATSSATSSWARSSRPARPRP